MCRAAYYVHYEEPTGITVRLRHNCGVQLSSVAILPQCSESDVNCSLTHLSLNPLSAKLFNLNFHPLEIVSR